MMAISGRMVYSTCSLNPLENEAVLCRLLKEVDGALEIVEAGSKLKGLIYNPGMTSWTPASKDMTFYEKFEDVPMDQRSIIHRELFPPKDIERFNLHKCIRVLPHHQNTGGFFIAVLEKRKPLPWEKIHDDKAIESKMRKEQEQNSDGTERPAKKPRRMQGFKEDPFRFFQRDEELFKSFNNFFELAENFDSTCLFTRCGEESKKKNIYFVSPEVRDILERNENNVKIINSGVKCFVRCDRRVVDCPYRLSNEGLVSIEHLIGQSRRIKINKEDLIKLLNHLNPAESLMVTELSSEMQLLHKMKNSGSCILEYHDQENDFDLFITGWRGTTSVRAYIDVNDSIHILRLLDADLSKYGTHCHIFDFKVKSTQFLFFQIQINSKKLA